MAWLAAIGEACSFTHKNVEHNTCSKTSSNMTLINFPTSGDKMRAENGVCISFAAAQGTSTCACV